MSVFGYLSDVKNVSSKNKKMIYLKIVTKSTTMNVELNYITSYGEIYNFVKICDFATRTQKWTIRTP